VVSIIGSSLSSGSAIPSDYCLIIYIMVLMVSAPRRGWGWDGKAVNEEFPPVPLAAFSCIFGCSEGRVERSEVFAVLPAELEVDADWEFLVSLAALVLLPEARCCSPHSLCHGPGLEPDHHPVRSAPVPVPLSPGFG
jgi:hypothetical protein